MVSWSCDANCLPIIVELHEGTPSGSEELRRIKGGNARVEPLAPLGANDGLPLDA